MLVYAPLHPPTLSPTHAPLLPQCELDNTVYAYTCQRCQYKFDEEDFGDSDDEFEDEASDQMTLEGFFKGELLDEAEGSGTLAELVQERIDSETGRSRENTGSTTLSLHTRQNASGLPTRAVVSFTPGLGPSLSPSLSPSHSRAGLSPSRDLAAMFSREKIEHSVRGTTTSAAPGSSRLFSRDDTAEIGGRDAGLGSRADADHVAGVVVPFIPPSPIKQRRLTRPVPKRLVPVRNARQNLKEVMAIQEATDGRNAGAVVKLMYQTENHHVQAAGCTSLGHLAVTGLDTDVVEEGGVGSIARAMTLHGKNLLLQRAACRSLYNMAIAAGGRCLDEISYYGAISTVLTVTKRHHKDPPIIWACARLTRLLAEGAASSARQFRDEVVQGGGREVFSAVRDAAEARGDRQSVDQCNRVLRSLERTPLPVPSQSPWSQPALGGLRGESRESGWSDETIDESMHMEDRLNCISVAQAFLHRLDENAPLPKITKKPGDDGYDAAAAARAESARAAAEARRKLQETARRRREMASRELKLKKLKKNWRVGRHPAVPDFMLPLGKLELDGRKFQRPLGPAKRDILTGRPMKWDGEYL